jgi:ribonuclease HIII
VADSKKIADGRITELARQLDAVVEHVEVVIGPERYNALYEKMANVNRMLAWAHATALEELLAEATADYAVLDQFGPEHRVRSALKEQGRALRLDLRPRAEADPAVAAASILARNTFNRSLGGLARRYSVKLPKGAGAPVLTAGRRLVEQHGREILARVAKLHFKTTAKLGS